MGVYKDATDLGVGFATRVGGVEGVFRFRGVSLLVIGLGLNLGVEGGFFSWGGMRLKLLTYVVGPFEFDGYVCVAGVICFDTFDNCKSGDILEKDDGCLV